MKKNAPRAKLYLDDRAKGMTYEQIARKYGVTRQRVGQVCGVAQKNKFRIVQKDHCVYVNLRNWMNDNQISRSEFVRRLGFQVAGSNMNRLGHYLRGEHNPPKTWIDRMLNVTGMSYETLFTVG